MWQVAPPEQSTLALLPTVIVHAEVPVHLRLHESPHAPVQSLEFAQSSVQLWPHVLSEIAQVCPDGQLQLEPVHFGGLPSEPHANTTNIMPRPIRRSFMGSIVQNAPRAVAVRFVH